jgi:hypothetical protein
MKLWIGAVILVGPCLLAAQPTYEPFVIRILRTDRVIEPSGGVSAQNETIHVYMRSRNGSLRHESRSLKDGVEMPPSRIELHDMSTRRSYRLLPDLKKAEWLKDAFADPTSLYNGEGVGSIQTVSGIPCRVLKTYFIESGVKKSEGRACRALDFGIVIDEFAEFPHPDQKRMIRWEARLLSVERGVDPPAALMSVGNDYIVAEVAGDCRTCSRK